MQGGMAGKVKGSPRCCKGYKTGYVPLRPPSQLRLCVQLHLRGAGWPQISEMQG